MEDEFWDFISGQKNTFSLIKESFVEIYEKRTLEEQLDVVFDRHKSEILISPKDI